MYSYYDLYGSFDLGINFEPLMASFDYLKIEKDFMTLLEKNYEYLAMKSDSKMNIYNQHDLQNSYKNSYNDLFFQVKDKQFLFQIDFPLYDFFKSDFKNKYSEVFEKENLFSMYVYFDGTCCFDFTQIGVPLFYFYAQKQNLYFADLISQEETLKMIFSLYQYDETHDSLITPYETSFSCKISYRNLFYQFIKYIYSREFHFRISKEEKMKIFNEEFEKKLIDFLKKHGNENYIFSENMIESEFLFDKNFMAWHFCNQFIGLLNKYFIFDSLINKGNPKIVLLQLLELLQDVLPNNMMSSSESAEELILAFNTKQENILEEINHYFMLDSSITTIGKEVFLTIKRMQVAMENTIQVLKKKNSKIDIRESTFKHSKGSLGTFLISNYEICQKEDIGNANMYFKIKEIHHLQLLNYYSIVDFILENKVNIVQEYKEHSKINRLGNILFYTFFEKSPLPLEHLKKQSYQKLILEYFHYLSFNRFLNENFTTNTFSLQQINACINKLEEMSCQANIVLESLSEKADIQNSFFKDEIQKNFIQTSQILQLKKNTKLDIVRVKNNHQKVIFNILIGIFSAFGIASSIISIAMADILGKIISLISIIVYLLIMIFGYMKNLDEK